MTIAMIMCVRCKNAASMPGRALCGLCASMAAPVGNGGNGWTWTTQGGSVVDPPIAKPLASGGGSCG